jgi:RND family efflux transporter MFP subunit
MPCAVFLANDWLSGRATCVAVLLLGLVGCARHGKPAPQGGDDRPPSKVNLQRSVELCQAQRQPLVYAVETMGWLEAEGQTEIAAGVTGIVDEVLFREGDRVDPSKILVKVDQRRYESALRLAEANVQRAKANLALAQDLARRTLSAGVGVSAEEKSKASLGLGIAEAEVLASQAALELARNHFDRSRVRAPYAGWINQRRITPGTYLEEKTVIATMADLSRIRLVGWVPETAARDVRELFGQQPARLKAVRTVTLPLGGVLAGNALTHLAAHSLIDWDGLPSGLDPEFALPAMPQRSYRARIFYLSTVANPDTHMFECKAEVLAPPGEQDLRPGFTARIRLPLQTADATLVPEESLRATERGFIVFTPIQQPGRDGKPEWIARAVPIKPGYRSPGWVEVRQGVKPGDWIVRRGAESLENGTPIRFSEDELRRLTANR